MKRDFVTTVPFADLYLQYLSIRGEIDAAIADVIRNSAFIRGPFVEKFEQDFAVLTNVPHCVSCANGTDALYIAMNALRIRPGDQVIVPAHSWISTSEAVTQAGGEVVFCDTDAKTFTIDPILLERKISSRTVGIIPVHLYGQSADMDPIMALARKHKLWVIEDCAQAFLARYNGKLVGTFGDIASFSFYPGKNLGAMGDAGAIVTADPDLARRMAAFARHGGLTKGSHEIEGINSRLDGLQAAVLLAKLKYISAWTVRRQEIAQRYSELLCNIDELVLPSAAVGREHVWHLYVVQHPRRDALAKHLSAHGIQTVVNYPVALPFLPAYRRFGHVPGEFPVAHYQQSRILSLPIFAEITETQIQAVADSARSFPLAAHKFP